MKFKRTQNKTSILERKIKSKNTIPEAWIKAAGMWKNKKFDPVKYIKKLRSEWKQMFTLDSNVLIYYFKGEKSVVEKLQQIIKKNTPLFISIITKAEILSYPEITPQEIEIFNELYKSLIVIYFDERICDLVIDIRKKYKFKNTRCNNCCNSYLYKFNSSYQKCQRF